MHMCITCNMNSLNISLLHIPVGGEGGFRPRPVDGPPDDEVPAMKYEESDSLEIKLTFIKSVSCTRYCIDIHVSALFTRIMYTKPLFIV